MVAIFRVFALRQLWLIPPNPVYVDIPYDFEDGLRAQVRLDPAIDASMNSDVQSCALSRVKLPEGVGRAESRGGTRKTAQDPLLRIQSDNENKDDEA